MNLYLLRVGADSTKAGGGFWSRKRPDRSYTFIPIQDKEEFLVTREARTYKDYTWNSQSVLEYLPRKIRGALNQYYIHDDPEFRTFTYGSPEKNQGKGTEKNYKTLSEMRRGDILVFYAAFTSNGKTIEGYYFFAYFIVDRATNLNKLTDEEEHLVKNNHHFIHKEKLRSNQVIVVGDTEQSRVLKKAVLLSSRDKDRRGSNYYPCPDVRHLLDGYCKSMNPSSIRKFNFSENGILQFKQYLDSKCV